MSLFDCRRAWQFYLYQRPIRPTDHPPTPPTPPTPTTPTILHSSLKTVTGSTDVAVRAGDTLRLVRL